MQMQMQRPSSVTVNSDGRTEQSRAERYDKTKHNRLKQILIIIKNPLAQWERTFWIHFIPCTHGCHCASSEPLEVHSVFLSAPQCKCKKSVYVYLITIRPPSVIYPQDKCSYLTLGVTPPPTPPPPYPSYDLVTCGAAAFGCRCCSCGWLCACAACSCLRLWAR